MGGARQPNGNIGTMFNEPDGSSAPSNVGSVIDHFSVYVDDVDAAVEAEMVPSRTTSLDHFGFRIPETLQSFAARIEATGYPPYLIRPNPPGSDLLWFEGPGGIHIEISSTAETPSN